MNIHNNNDLWVKSLNFIYNYLNIVINKNLFKKNEIILSKMIIIKPIKEILLLYIFLFIYI